MTIRREMYNPNRGRVYEIANISNKVYLALLYYSFVYSSYNKNAKWRLKYLDFPMKRKSLYPMITHVQTHTQACPYIHT